MSKTGKSSVPRNWYTTALNSPRKIIFSRYLGSAGALTVCWGIDFDCKNGSITIVNPSCAIVLSGAHYGVPGATGGFSLVPGHDHFSGIFLLPVFICENQPTIFYAVKINVFLR